MATTVEIILNSMSYPPMKQNSTCLEALLSLAKAMKKFTGKELLLNGSCVDYIIKTNAKGDDSNALLAIDQLAIKLKHSNLMTEGPGILLQAFTRPFKP